MISKAGILKLSLIKIVRENGIKRESEERKFYCGRRYKPQLKKMGDALIKYMNYQISSSFESYIYKIDIYSGIYLCKLTLSSGEDIADYIEQFKEDLIATKQKEKIRAKMCA